MTSQRVKLKDQILDGIARSVKEVQAYVFSSDGETVKVGNEARPLQRLVEHLDHAFLHGLKHITPGYWIFVKRFTHKLVISDILALDRLATNLGRSRAWLYQSLNEGALESYLRCFLDNDEVLKKFYIEHALLRDSERLTLLMTLVSGLDYVTFDLELNVAYFDLVSHIPRSASVPRDLEDTISIHSNASFESVSSSVCNDVEGSFLLGVESGALHEGSPQDGLPSAQSLEESGKSDINVVEPTLPAGREDTPEEEENAEIPAHQLEDAASNLDGSAYAPLEPDAAKEDDSPEMPRPLTLDLDTQANNNSSNELKHVTRNYSTPDFDINMEKVAEQDQNLEVIRIRKKTKKKKKQRKSSKGESAPILNLQEPRRGKRFRDRSSSPSTVSIASSCIEESELEDKENSLGGEGSISSMTNISAECSAVEDEAEGAKASGNELPQSDNSLQESYGRCRLQESGNGVTAECTENLSGNLQACDDRRDRSKEDVLEVCRVVVNSILDLVGRDDREPCHQVTITNCSGELPEGQEQRPCSDLAVEDMAKLRLPSFSDAKMQDSFNSSVEMVDQSMIYWQGEITDSSFDADMASSTPAKAGGRGFLYTKDKGIEGGDDDVFVQYGTSSKTENSKDSKDSNGTGSGCAPSTSNSHRGQPSHVRTIMGSLDYDQTVSMQMETVKTKETAYKVSHDKHHKVQLELPLNPEASDGSFVQLELSLGITTCSSDSLSSGIGSASDTTAHSSRTPLTPATDSDQGVFDTTSRSGKSDSSFCLSGVQCSEDDEFGFVLVDVVQEETDKSDDLGERCRGDGRDASLDPLNAVDVNANDSRDQSAVDVRPTDEFDFGADGETETTHEAEMKVDNNLKLYLMLEIFKIEDEKFCKLLRMSTGHMEGNLLPAFLLLTDLAIYILRRGDRNGRFSTESRILYDDLDYIVIGLNYQSVQCVCKNRRRHFWLTTGSESLTRFFLHSVRDVITSHNISQALCILTDPTAQAIGLRKYVAGEEKIEMSDVRIHLYTLVHWEDLLDTNTAADLQLYIPLTKRKGMLHYKTRETFFVGSYWKSAYFKLKNNVLKRYGREAEEADLSIDLESHDFGGCRRVHHSDRPFSFELVYTNGSPSLQLSCENELQLSLWLQCICEVVLRQHSISHQRGPQPNPCQPSCAVISSKSLLLCLEDYQTHFFRTLARTSLASISHIERSSPELSYLVLNFKNSECDNPWLLYFNCSKEQNKFISHLSTAFQELTERNLKICSVQDEKLARRCSNCQDLILSAWQRSDSLGRGRRGDSW